MESRTVEQNELAELKVRILMQEEQVARFGRLGLKAKARCARDQLYLMLHRREVLEALHAR
jgi:hypothetical protein